MKLPSAVNLLVGLDHTITLKEEKDAIRTFRDAVLEAAAEEGEKWARWINHDAMIAQQCGDRIRKLKEEL